MTVALGTVLDTIDTWGATHATAAIVGPDGVVAAHGDLDHPYAWASVTKPVTTLAVLIAMERGEIDLDEPAGPPGSTARHLLAHASGLPFEGDATLAAPGRRRIYSNPGFDLLGALVAERAGAPYESVLRERVLGPLGMTGTRLDGRPSEGLRGPLVDLVAFARDALRPTLVTPETARAATQVQFPGIPGVVPGVGRFDPCDWGLGWELHDGKAPHWMGERNSSETFGHFGGAGTFLWIDPVADVALVALTDRVFGPWALEVWPSLADAALDAALAAARQGTHG